MVLKCIPVFCLFVFCFLFLISGEKNLTLWVHTGVLYFWKKTISTNLTNFSTKVSLEFGGRARAESMEKWRWKYFFFLEIKLKFVTWEKKSLSFQARIFDYCYVMVLPMCRVTTLCWHVVLSFLCYFWKLKLLKLPVNILGKDLMYLKKKKR